MNYLGAPSAAFALAVLLTATGCASSPMSAPPSVPSAVAPTLASATVPSAPAVVSPSAGPEGAPAEPAALPTECASSDAKTCLPDADFAKRLCAGVFPDVALTMFGKTQPWTRAYLTGNTEAWNASGGKVTRSHMIFDEEVLVVARRERAPGIVVTGAAQSYDVLRWDGTCASLEGGEMTFKKPPVAKSPPIPWRRLSEATRTALLAAPKVQASQRLVQKECSAPAPVANGATGGGSTASAAAAKAGATRCDKADAAFDRAIVEFVHGGDALPVPARRP